MTNTSRPKFLFGRAAGRSCLATAWATASRSYAVATNSWPRFAVVLLSAPIHFYRRFLSQLKPPSCRFDPTCSAYALEAIAAHGAGRGLLLAVKRILRCHPISWLGGSSGFDPVPLPKK